jgi:hypothetical protein
MDKIIDILNKKVEALNVFSLLQEHEFKQIESPAAEKVKPCRNSEKYP